MTDEATFAANGGATTSTDVDVDVGVKRPLVGEEVEDVDVESAPRRSPTEDDEPADSPEKVRGGMRRAPHCRARGDRVPTLRGGLR